MLTFILILVEIFCVIGIIWIWKNISKIPPMSIENIESLENGDVIAYEILNKQYLGTVISLDNENKRVLVKPLSNNFRYVIPFSKIKFKL